MQKITSKQDFLRKKRKGPVLVDFFTTWCGPCKLQSKVLEENEAMLTRKFPGLTIYGLDCDQVANVADKYEIMAIPTLVLFTNETAISMSSGVKPLEKIMGFLEENLGDS